MKILIGIKRCLILAIVNLNQNITIIQTNVVGKMKDERTGVFIEQIVGLKYSYLYSFLVDDSNEHKKQRVW